MDRLENLLEGRRLRGSRVVIEEVRLLNCFGGLDMIP